MWIEDILGEK
jgi:hypothetical protein